MTFYKSRFCIRLQITDRHKILNVSTVDRPLGTICIPNEETLIGLCFYPQLTDYCRTFYVSFCVIPRFFLKQKDNLFHSKPYLPIYAFSTYCSFHPFSHCRQHTKIPVEFIEILWIQPAKLMNFLHTCKHMINQVCFLRKPFPKQLHSTFR